MTPDEIANTFAQIKQTDGEGFDEMLDAVYLYQRTNNPVYGRYCASLGSDLLPYLPVEAFKHVPVCTFDAKEAERVFVSSGTGRDVPSRHYVYRLWIYEKAISTHFEAVFGRGPFTLIGHLPHYREQGEASSLLHMVDFLIRNYGDSESGFFLENEDVLERAILRSAEAKTTLILFGAAFGLLDLMETSTFRLPTASFIIETGGMKTYRQAIQRDELHRRLADGFGVTRDRVRSEYGMCEMMSQCYTRGGCLFYPTPWMRFEIIDPDHPFKSLPPGQQGLLALVDLANVYTVSALLTQDLAVQKDQGFEVLGRLSGAELRGCNFLLEHLQ